MVKIKKQIVSDEIIQDKSYGWGNPANYITVHQTGNFDIGADAQAHADIQSDKNPRDASWQIQADDVEAIQSFPDGVMCWAATDGHGPGNTESIHVEICVNKDGDYVQAVKNGADVVKQKMAEHGLGIGRVKQHHHWYDKNCPSEIRKGRAGIDWGDFLDLVQGHDIDNKPGKPKKNKGGSSNNGLLQKGDSGKAVKHVQKRLIRLGYDLSRFGADGHYGNETKAAVKEFQKDEGIAVDGIVGLVTRKYLNNADKNHGDFTGKRVESKVNNLRFYSRPSWSDAALVNTIDKGWGFPEILDKVKVGSGHQYKVKNSSGDVFYITAHNKYVRVE